MDVSRFYGRSRKIDSKGSSPKIQLVWRMNTSVWREGRNLNKIWKRDSTPGEDCNNKIHSRMAEIFPESQGHKLRDNWRTGNKVEIELNCRYIYIDNITLPWLFQRFTIQIVERRKKNCYWRKKKIANTKKWEQKKQNTMPDALRMSHCIQLNKSIYEGR